MSTNRSHPPSLVRLAERTIRDESLFGRGDVVLCACSGGPDSTALLHVIAMLRRRLGHAVAAHGVDHGLRPEARNELAMAEKVALSLGVPFGTTSVSVPSGPNLQARARAARLQALGRAAVAIGCATIATGHTADDRAETVILRLLRGAGPKGLAALPPSAPLPPDAKGAGLDAAPAKPSIALIRPLIGARRTDVLAHLTRHSLPYASDPSNRDPRFSRVRVRQEVLPLLESLSPGVVGHLCTLADMLLELPNDPVLEGLGRAQRREVARALHLGRPSVRLRTEGGRELQVTFPQGRIVLIE